jgi:hypothetical protein
MKRHLAEKMFAFKSPILTSYQQSVNMLCLSFTVFELFTEIQVSSTKARPITANIFVLKPDSNFLIMVC